MTYPAPWVPGTLTPPAATWAPGVSAFPTASWALVLNGKWWSLQLAAQVDVQIGASGRWAGSRTVGHVSRPSSMHPDSLWETLEAQLTTPRDEGSWPWGHRPSWCLITPAMFWLPDNLWAFSKKLQPSWDNVHFEALGLTPWRGSVLRVKGAED